MPQKRTMFSPLNAPSLSVNAVELITEAILSGKIKPGQRLNETHLAAEFRVSRTPIREALQQLQDQGLVENVPRRGMFVVSLESEDVHKINSLRLVLEAEALYLCRANLNPQGEKQLAQQVERMEAMDPELPTQVIRLDLEFHRTVWALAGNQYLTRILTSITTPLFAHAVISRPRTAQLRIFLDSHRPLLEFVQGKRTESAEDMMLAHLKHRWKDMGRFSGRLLSAQGAVSADKGAAPKTTTLVPATL
jgi:DNA-binding GntR family transcriptional regulator